MIVLVEEPSMETFLRGILPPILGQNTTFDIHPFQGKQDLMDKLPARLRGYANWIPEGSRIIVLVDRDDEECARLKKQMEEAAATVGMRTPSNAGRRHWQVANRIAIEELESWYFGDWEAVRESYPKVKSAIPDKAQFRDPDRIAGGTWEAFERVLRGAGYFKSGLRKVEAAREISARFVPERNRSQSFQVFRSTVLQAIS
ncbi:MAG TPA: DUF4276 family protein [Terriglobia bacterium]|nr:DUF4276 family protein [Terriglobia bacterium]